MIPRPCQNLLCSLQLHKSWPRGVRSTLPLTATLQTQRQNAQQAKKQKAERLANAELIFAFAQLRGKLPKNCLQGAWKSMFLTKIFKNDTLQKLWPSKCPQGFSDIFHHLGYSWEAWKVKGKSYRSGFSIFDTKFHHEIIWNSNFDWFSTSSIFWNFL